MFFKKNKANNEIIEESNQFDDKNEEKIEEITTQSLLNEILDYFSTTKAKDLGLVRRGIKDIKDLFNDIDRYYKSKKIPQGKVEDVKEMFEKYLFGYYILDDLINDDEISDIRLVAPDNIRIKKLGERFSTDLKFNSMDEMNRFIRLTAIKNEVNISDINALQIFTDKKSNKDYILRFDIATDYVTSDGAKLHIRKIPRKKYSREDLIRLNFAKGEEDIDLLISSIKNGDILLLSGKGASGKTTLFNTLLEHIPYSKSALIIQESEELFSNTHPEMLFYHVREAKGESRVNYSLKDISKHGLLTDIDYFGIGEIKGGEAKYWFNAAYTGAGCLASIHAQGVEEAPDKLIDYIKYETDYKRVDLLKMIKNMKLKIVFIKDFHIEEIAEIKDYDYLKEELIFRQLFKR